MAVDASRTGDADRSTGDPVGKPARISTNAAWVLAGNAGYAAAQWTVIVLIARLADPAAVGRYGLGLAISAPIVLLASLALRTVQVTDPGTGFSFPDYLRLRLAGMAVALVTIAVVATWLGPQTGPVVLLVGVAKALDAIADIYFGLFQRHELMRMVGLTMLLNGLVTVVAVAVVLVFTNSVVWAAAASVLGSAVSTLGYCLPVSRVLQARLIGATLTGPARPPVGALIGLATVALPLGLSSSLISLAANIPRYAVGAWLGAVPLGFFTALSYLVLAPTMVAGALAQALLPRMAVLHATGRTGQVRVLVLRLVGVCVLVALLAVPFAGVVGAPLLRLLYSEPYAQHSGLLPIFVLSVAFSAIIYFLDAALCATRRFGSQLVAGVSALALTALATLLIPWYGLTGAAWALAVPVGMQCLLKSGLLYRALRRRVEPDDGYPPDRPPRLPHQSGPEVAGGTTCL